MPDDANAQSRRNARRRLALRAERAFGQTSVRKDALSVIESSGDTTSAPSAPIVSKHGPEGPGKFLEAAPAVPKRALAKPALPQVHAAPTPQNPSPPARNLIVAGPFTSPILSSEDKRRRLIALDENEVRGCTRCRLCEGRTQTVFGTGSPDAELFFIGEGPGQNEDEQGVPFVGRSGELLTKQIHAMGLTREQVFIANTVKCRPPNNRTPSPDEVATCTPYLERQIEIIRPRVIVTLGLPAMQHMLQTKNSMSKMRGTWQEWRGIKVMPTFHPAYLLRAYTPANRALVWSDLQQVMTELGLSAPKK